MTEQPGAGRLDPETLAAYVDGLLPPEERARVEAIIAADPDVYEWLVNAVNAVEDTAIGTPADVRSPIGASARGHEVAAGGTSAPTIVPFTRRRAVIGTVGALVAAAAAVVLVVRTPPDGWRGRLLSSAPFDTASSRVAPLVEALGDARHTEARLTGGFKYGPLRQVLRGSNDLSQQNLKLLAAAGELQRRAQKEPSAANLHAWGVAQLLLDDLDGAVDTLGIALQLEPQAAAVLTDRGSALLTRAGRQQSDEDVPAAADAFERALALDANLSEALFGRALALERLGFTESAREAWRKYLAVDAASRWADEARTHLERLERPEAAPGLRGLLERFSLDPAVTPDAQSVREHLEDVLIPALADASAAPDGRARVADLHAVVDELTRVQQDATLSDTFAPLAASLDTPQSRAILEGFRCHAQMRAAYLAFEQQALLVSSERCARIFRDAGAPFQHWSAVYRARALQSTGRIDESRAATSAVLAAVDRDRYPLVYAWALVQEGSLAYRAGAAAAAMQPLKTARDLLAERGEAERAAGAADILAAVYRNAGDARRQWRSVRQAQASQPSRPSTIRWHATRVSGVNYAVESGYSYLAGNVLQTLLDAAETSRVAGRIAESAMHLARIHAERGDAAAAGRQAAIAQTATAAILDETVKRPLEGAIALYQAEYGDPTDPAGTAAAVRLARERLARVNDHTRTLTLVRLELQAAIAARAPDRADALIADGMTLIRRQGALFAAPVERAKFNATASAFSNLAATHYVDTERSDLALALLDATAQTSDPVSPAGLSAPVPEGHAILVFRAASSELWRWCITAKATTFVKLHIPASDIAVALANVRAALQSGGTVDAPVLDRALDGLPADAHAAERWVFVLRDFPAGLPAAALRLDTGVMVADRHECVFASSVGAYLRRAATTTPAPSRRLVRVVSGPADSGTLDDPRLVGGEFESQTIARLHDAQVVPAARATVEEFTRALDEADIVHFVGHAAASRRGALDSYLVLEPSPAHPMGLFTGEIAASQKVTTETLILASCASAEPSPSSTALQTLAAAFSAAGVRQVVGTLWAVADDEAADAFVALHELLREGISVPESVRRVQTRFRDERRPGRAWASLAVIVA